MADTSKQMFRIGNWIARYKANSSATFQRFQEMMAECPAYAFESMAERGIEASAGMIVASMLESILESAREKETTGGEEAALARVEREVLQRVVQVGRDLCASTDAGLVLHHRHLVVTWNRCYQDLFAE